MNKTLISVCCAMLLGMAPLAHADIAVIVSQQSPLTAVDTDQVKMIFMGKIGSFRDGNTVVAIDQPKSLLREQFYRAVASKTPYQMASYWARMMFTGAGMPPAQADSTNDVLARVAADPSAIGYVDASQVNAKVKVVLRVPAPR